MTQILWLQSAKYRVPEGEQTIDDVEGFSKSQGNKERHRADSIVAATVTKILLHGYYFMYCCTRTVHADVTIDFAMNGFQRMVSHRYVVCDFFDYTGHRSTRNDGITSPKCTSHTSSTRNLSSTSKFQVTGKLSNSRIL